MRAVLAGFELIGLVEGDPASVAEAGLLQAISDYASVTSAA